MDHRGMNCLLAVIAFLMLVEFGQTLSVLKARQVTDATNQQLVDPAITDPKAIHADKIMWYTQDPDQQDHIRALGLTVTQPPRFCSSLHPRSYTPGSCSEKLLPWMVLTAAYGDYRTLCPSTFAVEGNEFEVLQDFETAEGQKGFVARVPFMQKDSDSIPGLYNSARIATDNWAVAKQAVNATGLKFSVTGHGIGGSVAQLAALDLGTQGLVHYAHSQAAPRSMSPTAARILSEVFQGESGQHAVANHDYFPHMIPRSKDFVRVNSAVWIFGNRTEWMRNCHYYAENIACLGNGTSIQDN
ncbi:uncharacterized protein PGTG_08403 [Puccinia graminis f. sp. tritici CRL 75-36-700-3]|uniref:Fungal lipase-type domain-containing protein n=1 Tax=Puccinia graminis f. sp. tritici (strain CRL 75-36-700-3 / race SCCL) TaxID=418459 RepID=E3KDL1_PUCGT|nr:uncharacterized protein PGTG_08403 [Puccinia graminis f. sp. tritici CRL 75-36-700-3]EFP82447.2 hypothetical protein PGTG_08403 [Puccinia graminis f. sp. tritici CRL 75-36-700-3]